MVEREHKEVLPMKKILTLVLALMLLLCAVPALAYSFTDDYPEYVVESTSPAGYCYQYSKPSSINGINQGRHNNGEIVKVIDWDASEGYALTICSNGKVGYIKKNSLALKAETTYREMWRVYSVSPNGYCYMYNKPSSIKGTNLGRYNNGEYLEMVDYNADTNYAKVRDVLKQKVGYVKKSSLVNEMEYKSYQFYVMVKATEPKGLTYMYDQPSSIKGINQGLFKDGTWMGVLDWFADADYALVEAPNGKMGYVKKVNLSF